VTGVQAVWRVRHPELASVTSAGRVLAVAPGLTYVRAETPEGLVDSAAISIRPLEVTVSVHPAAVDLPVGDTVRLSASARTGAGGTLTGVSFTWQSRHPDVATVTNGLVRGVTPGRAVIRATGGGGSDSAIVTVKAAVTILLLETFDATNFAERGWYDNTGLTTTTAEHVAGSTRALELRYPQGATLPTMGSAARHLFPASDRVYVSFWVKYAPDWIGSGRNYQPHEIQLLTNQDSPYVGPSVSRLTAYIEHNYQQGGIPQVHITDAANIDATNILTSLVGVTEARAVAGCNGNGDPYATICFQRGTGWGNEKKWRASAPWFLPVSGARYQANWHFIEAYFELNTIENGRGMPNGTVRYWYDGQVVLAHDDVLFRTGAHPAMLFNQLVIGPYMGEGSPRDQAMWIDVLTVANGRP
jgi:hypothetical protein